MTTTPEGRRELKALAEKATPGPWKADGTIYEHMVSEIRSIMPGEERGIAQVWQHPQGFADARFIAAANPATVLSLLAALEEAEGRLDDLTNKLDDALHDYGNAESEAKGLEADVADLTARAEASEQRESALREALTSAALNLDACAVAIRKGGKSEGRHTLVEGWAERARAVLTTKSGEAS